MEFCTLKSPQFYEFGVTNCRTCSFTSKNFFFEVAMSKLLCGKMGSFNADLTPSDVYSSLGTL